MSSIDLLCLEQIFCVWNSHFVSVTDGGHMSSTEICVAHVSSIEFVRFRPKIMVHSNSECVICK